MVIYGSGSVVRELTVHRLIDEYRLIVNPVVLGKGKVPGFTFEKRKSPSDSRIVPYGGSESGIGL